MTDLLEIENLTVALPTRAGYRNAVDDLSLTVARGEVVGLAGESGSGKTMTALSLFGLLPNGARVTGAARLDGTAAVTLVVAKQSGENTVATATEIKQRLKEISTLLPKDVRADIIADQSVFIEASVGRIRQHLIEGSIFASIIIFLFLANIRTTLIAAVAIPTSIISTFALMAAVGFTLNQITMLALTLMVGIVIDDAIIVLERGHIVEVGRHDELLAKPDGTYATLYQMQLLEGRKTEHRMVPS